jgi:DNA-binding NtrC family response regulator
MKNPHLKYVLVVDDEEEYRTILHKYLQSLGYGCETASEGFEGLEKLHQQHFDLVISDIKMANKGGIQFMHEARELFPSLDFIIMTGHSDEYSYSDIIAAGATDFISKPFEMARLKSKLERIERERQTLHQLHEANEQLRKINSSLQREVEVNTSITELSKELIGSSSIENISRLVLKYAGRLTESPLGFVGYIDQNSGKRVGSMSHVPKG